jgi:flagellar protein FlaG
MEVNLPKLAETGFGKNAAAVESVKPADAKNLRTRQSQEATGSEAGKKPAVNEQELTELTDALNKFMTDMNADLQFAIHEKTHRMMVRLVDIKTQKVLKEFPPHELLDTLAAISEYVGALLDKKV